MEKKILPGVKFRFNYKFYNLNFQFLYILPWFTCQKNIKKIKLHHFVINVMVKCLKLKSLVVKFTKW